MNKNLVVEELEEIIRNIKVDTRKRIKGIKIMLCDNGWTKKSNCSDSNLFIDWDEINKTLPILRNGVLKYGITK